jgi:hypothetical protein
METGSMPSNGPDILCDSLRLISSFVSGNGLPVTLLGKTKLYRHAVGGGFLNGIRINLSLGYPTIMTPKHLWPFGKFTASITGG